jgi:hypothetical protein
MPQFLKDYNEWWMDFWSAHPVVFWTALTLALSAAVFGRIYGKKRS